MLAEGGCTGGLLLDCQLQRAGIAIAAALLLPQLLPLLCSSRAF